MNPTIKTKLMVLAVAPAAMLAFSSCSTTHDTPFTSSNPNASYEKGVPGGTVVDSYEVTARVTAIDRENRLVTVVGAQDKKTIFKCGSEVINFDQIHLNDQVTVLLTTQLAVALSDPKNPTPDGNTKTVLLAAKGAKPGGVVAETTQTTAKLTGVDTLRHEATLRFADGTVRTYAVRPDVDLAHRKLDEEVVIRSTVAMALWVKCP